jgi:hypothetical protein
LAEIGDVLKAAKAIMTVRHDHFICGWYPIQQPENDRPATDDSDHNFTRKNIDNWKMTKFRLFLNKILLKYCFIVFFPTYKQCEKSFNHFNKLKTV